MPKVFYIGAILGMIISLIPTGIILNNKPHEKRVLSLTRDNFIKQRPQMKWLVHLLRIAPIFSILAPATTNAIFIRLVNPEQDWFWSFFFTFSFTGFIGLVDGIIGAIFHIHIPRTRNGSVGVIGYGHFFRNMGLIQIIAIVSTIVMALLLANR